MTQEELFESYFVEDSGSNDGCREESCGNDYYYEDSCCRECSDDDGDYVDVCPDDCNDGCDDDCIIDSCNFDN